LKKLMCFYIYQMRTLFYPLLFYAGFGFRIKYDGKDAVMVRNMCVGTPCQDMSWTKIDTTLNVSWVFSDTVSGTGDFGNLPTYDKESSSSHMDESGGYHYESFNGNQMSGSLVWDTFRIADIDANLTFGDVTTYSLCSGRPSSGCKDYTNNCERINNGSGVQVCQDIPETTRYSYSSAIGFDQNSSFLTNSDSFTISVMDRRVSFDAELTGGKTFNLTESESDSLWGVPLLRIVAQEKSGDMMDIWSCPASCGTSCRGVIDTGRFAISMSTSSKTAITATDVWDGCVVSGNDQECKGRAASSRGLPSLLFVFGENDTMTNAVSISTGYYGTYYCDTCLALAGYEDVSDCDIYLGLAWLKQIDVGLKRSGEEDTITFVSRTALFDKEGAWLQILYMGGSVIVAGILACLLRLIFCPPPKKPVAVQVAEVQEDPGPEQKDQGMVFAGSGQQGSYTTYNENRSYVAPTIPPSTDQKSSENKNEPASTAEPSGNRLGAAQGEAKVSTQLTPAELREQRLKALGV